MQNGKTPMHWAAVYGHSSVVTALLAAGAKPDTADKVCSEISTEICPDSSVA